ncbi:Alpha/Beta hydrolase protein [Papiliotrema laurentii]|uniref:Alpha/Beta hydrolase protein n=1 Tax=Papiliotrema laurentii TaxID=5418 RepID=A0AAD9FRB9_PAPLA|nr:Alpha/Beta hydrolase protein [Papiliotrema laurentii]
MGGWTVLYYILKYPPTPSPVSAAADSPPRVQVAGAFVMCPMVEASPESRPHYLTEMAGRGIQYLAGTLPLAKSLRGKVSRDPRVEEDFFADPLCYHGWLRVATGFSLLSGMTELDKSAEKIDIPIRIIHGSSDRVTSHLGTQKLFNRLPNKDKQFEVYEGYEHVMLRIGHDEKDDEERQRVLADWESWLLERC